MEYNKTQTSPFGSSSGRKAKNVNFTVLRKALEAVEAAYQGPSTILKNVADFTTKPIADWDKNDLQVWANHITTVRKTKPLIKAELIAGVKRAVKLQHGFFPRVAQVLTVLILLPERGKGRLAQVNTGEGKSLIVAMLAAVHALQGKQVDVITTSTELSIPEVKRQEPFFQLLNLKVAENSKNNKNNDKRKAYKSHIVYGIAADFQADILQQEFLGNALRGDRKHDIIIVDEVDSLLFDNRSHSVRLSSPNPGMLHVTKCLAAVWQRIQFVKSHFRTSDGQTYFLSDLKFASEATWKDHAHLIADEREFLTITTTDYLNKLLRPLDWQESLEHQEYLDKYYDLMILQQNERQRPMKTHHKLEQELRELPWNQRHPIIKIPNHLQNFAKSQIPHWIKHCLNAVYVYERDVHYAIVNNRIVPIQYNETGVFQLGLIWSDGLTQFLQMKEGLPVDPEGVATNFISNVGFFKRYGNAIYGLTGTLGEEATKDFLCEVYDTDFIVIPPHKRKTVRDNGDSPYICKELPAIIHGDILSYYATLIQEILYHAEQKRAVLVICKVIRDAHRLVEQLKTRYKTGKVFSYTGEDEGDPKEEVDSGDIVVATNIAGRGTDLKTTDSVEASGGLYVVVTFLPDSYRVELQNVGRTARAGKRGMAQLILFNEGGATIESLKAARKKKEEIAIKTAKGEVQKMLLLDTLFQKFCKLAAKYLPSAHDSQNFRLAETLAPQWDAYLQSEGSDDERAKKFQEWKTKKREKWRVQTGQHGLDANARNLHDAQFEEKLVREEPKWQKEYTTKLLERFCRGRPTIAEAVKGFLLNGSLGTVYELSQKYDWGPFERKAVEERWALWLKSKHVGERTHAELLSLLNEFDDEFVPSIEESARNDEFIENQYFYVLKGNDWVKKYHSGPEAYSTQQLHPLDKAIRCYDRAISLDPTFSVQARYNKASALVTFPDNKGRRQEMASEELKKAKKIIITISWPSLQRLQNLFPNGEAQKHTE